VYLVVIRGEALFVRGPDGPDDLAYGDVGWKEAGSVDDDHETFP